MAETIKVLSIDAGGVRGIIPGVILDYIETCTGKSTFQLFDLITGTSTGGIMALGLVRPGEPREKARYSAADMIGLYEEAGETIFSYSIWDKIHSGFGLTNEKYSAETVETVLEKYFGDARLSQVLTDVIIPSYDIERRDCYFFKSRKAKKAEADDFLLRQVARAASAAPTYFPPCLIYMQGATPDLSLIDGGVFASNPTLCGFAEARRMYPEATDFLVVAIGTGKMMRKIPYDKARDWGLLGWAPDFMDIVYDGMVDSVDYQMSWLLPQTQPKQYYRFQIELTLANDDMDDASSGNIKDLKAEARKILKASSKDLEDLCQLLA